MFRTVNLSNKILNQNKLNNKQIVNSNTKIKASIIENLHFHKMFNQFFNKNKKQNKRNFKKFNKINNYKQCKFNKKSKKNRTNS